MSDRLYLKMLPGAYYRHRTEDGFQVFRILDIEVPWAYHATHYREHFETADEINPSLLGGLVPSLMHMPLSLATLFTLTDLEYVGHRTLREEDLFGYKTYMEAALGVSAEDAGDYLGRVLDWSVDEARECTLLLEDDQSVEVLNPPSADPFGTEITFNHGGKIVLRKLFQYATYGTMIEGVPGKRCNEEIIERARDQSVRLFGGGLRTIFQWGRDRSLHCKIQKPGASPAGTVVIEPERRRDPDLEKEWEELAEFMDRCGNPIEFLPEIACIGLFEASFPEEIERREVVLVWFQNVWAMPICQTVVRKIKERDWTFLSSASA